MEKLRIVLAGVGNRSLPKVIDQSNWLGWVELIKRSEKFELVAAHDVSEEAIGRIVHRGYLRKEQTYLDLHLMLKNIPADAILIANPIEYHSQTVKTALEADLHILVEKPFVQNLSDGNHLLSLIKSKGRIVSVVHNWRTKDVAQALVTEIKKSTLGRIGHVFFRYIRNRENSQYPKYIFEEKFPLLYAMGIHHLDLMRYILDDEFVSVVGTSFKPSWSLYHSDTGLNLHLKTKKNVDVIYTGTISSMCEGIAQESLVVEGENGSFVNDSEWLEPPLWFYPKNGGGRIDLTKDIVTRGVDQQYDRSDVFILNNFYQSILGREQPVCSAEDAFYSVCVLEACRKACETKAMVEINSFQNSLQS